MTGLMDKMLFNAGAEGVSQMEDFVRPLVVIDLRLFHRIAGVAQIDEVDALDHAPVFDVEAGDNSLGQHCVSASAAMACARVKAPS